MRLVAPGNLPVALRSRSRWVPSPTCLRPSDSSAATFQPFRSRVLRAAGPEGNGLKRSTWPEATRRVAIDRHRDGFNLGASVARVKYRVRRCGARVRRSRSAASRSAAAGLCCRAVCSGLQSGQTVARYGRLWARSAASPQNDSPERQLVFGCDSPATARRPLGGWSGLMIPDLVGKRKEVLVRRSPAA